MALDSLQTMNVIEAMETLAERKRPPEHIREKLDIGYKIEGQDVFVFEIRPRFDNPKVKREYPMAKTTFVKSKNHWKVFWMRQDLKWHSYEPKPTVKTIQQFAKLVEDDRYCCFWG